MIAKKQKKIQSWLQLIRVPNLFTVPGDILVGHACVTAFSDFSLWRFCLLCFVSALLYCGGLILNDCFDYDEDRRERPERPLPSGAIELQEAYGAWIVGTAIALFTCWFLGPATFKVALILTALIVLYNGPARRIPVMAFLIMGLCRGFNILLGASTAWGSANFTASISPVFLTETLYILAVTYIAYNETKRLPDRLWCMMPFLVAASGGFLCVIVFGINMPGFFVFLLFLTVTLLICNTLDDKLPQNLIPPKIGQLIRNLMLLQAAFTVMAAPQYLWYALSLIALFPIAARVSRSFYSS